jgi:DNA-binding PadR family transcriptional regulator
MVYRFLDDFNKKDFVSVDRVVIGNRLQGLYRITAKGKTHLEVLSTTLQKLLPPDLIGGDVEDILSGKLSPIDVMLKTIPEEERLTRLKQIRNALRKGLKQIEQEISELEKRNRDTD